MDPLQLDYEFLKPLVSAWLAKFGAAEQTKKRWKEVSDECVMYYSKSAAAMWSPEYTRKFWKGIKAPRFQLSLNKAYEYVAIFLPNLFWEVPHRTVTPKGKLDFPEELFQDPSMAAIYQQLMPQQQMLWYESNVRAMLMQEWLNYTPSETPDGGLGMQTELGLLDGLLKGRAAMVARVFQKEGSNRNITGHVRISPNDLLTDPGSSSFGASKWIAIRHEEYHWEVERRFNLPEGYLKGRASLESLWRSGELSTDDPNGTYRNAGLTNDIVVWYEVYSKMGPGCRSTSMESTVRDHLEKEIGDYAYLAICPSCPYPLNCTSEQMRNLPTSAIKQKFAWPIEFYRDDRWPVEIMDFFADPDSSWPVPPLGPALGELKLLNFPVPWATNRVWSSSRDFWSVASQNIDDYRQYLLEGEDQCIIPCPIGVDDVRKAVQILSQPETRQDLWKVIEIAENLFDKRTGLTETAFGRNENGTQNRTAEETIAKSRAVGVRPEFMAKKVVAWQSEIAASEANLARAFVTPDDVIDRVGPLGAALWERYVMSSDPDVIARQMTFSVGAASIRRPNRDKDVANLQQVMPIFAQPAIQYGFTTGDFTAYNTLVKKWAELHDADLDGAMLSPLPPPQPLPPETQGEGAKDQDKGQGGGSKQQQPPPVQVNVGQPQPQQPIDPMALLGAQSQGTPMGQQIPPELAMLMGQM